MDSLRVETKGRTTIITAVGEGEVDNTIITDAARFFLNDPLGDGMQYFECGDARDSAARDMIDSYLSAGMTEDVIKITIGNIEVTHAVVRDNVTEKPVADMCGHWDEEARLWDGGDHICTYELEPVRVAQ